MIQMNQNDFHNYIHAGDKPVLVDFSAPWCVYCRRIDPAMKKLSETLDGVVVGKVSIDDEPELARRERIEVVPTLVLYHKGQALGSIVAPESRARIESFVRETLGEGI